LAPSSPGRTFAMGDIHGCIHALEKVLQALAPQPDDTIICLGDVIDYGRDTAAVIDRLIILEGECRLTCLLGNHEEMLLESLTKESVRDSWLNCGGWETINSYRYGGQLSDIPADHIDFLRDCHRYAETRRHFFMHANYDPELPVNDQPPAVARWSLLEEPYPEPHCSGKTAVVGHTEQRNGEILDLGHVTCIDTYCRGYGWLTAYEVNTKQVIQASRWGMLRQGEDTDGLAKANAMLHSESTED